MTRAFLALSALALAATVWAAAQVDLERLVTPAVAKIILSRSLKESEVGLAQDGKEVLDGADSAGSINVIVYLELQKAHPDVGPPPWSDMDAMKKDPAGLMEKMKAWGEKEKIWAAAQEDIKTRLSDPKAVRGLYEKLKPALVEEIKAQDKVPLAAAYLRRIVRDSRLQVQHQFWNEEQLNTMAENSNRAAYLNHCKAGDPQPPCNPSLLKYLNGLSDEDKAAWKASQVADRELNARLGATLEPMDHYAMGWLNRRRLNGSEAAMQTWVGAAQDLADTLVPPAKPGPGKKAPQKKGAAKKE
jgi:hypothetical protein